MTTPQYHHCFSSSRHLWDHCCHHSPYFCIWFGSRCRCQCQDPKAFIIAARRGAQKDHMCSADEDERHMHRGVTCGMILSQCGGVLVFKGLTKNNNIDTNGVVSLLLFFVSCGVVSLLSSLILLFLSLSRSPRTTQCVILIVITVIVSL
jgi:hypothetical protein